MEYKWLQEQFEAWLREHDLACAISRVQLTQYKAELPGCDAEGRGNVPNAAIAHLAKEISGKTLFINGESFEVPVFYEELPCGD